MSEADWKRAAIAELRSKINGSIEVVNAAAAREQAARQEREAAEKDIDDIRAAAATLGLDLGEDYDAGVVIRGADLQAQQGLTARDVVLDALQAAYPHSMKAAELRKTIESRLGREVHYKTPGMTLFRLKGEGLVRSDGHRWYAVMGDQQRVEPQQEEMPIGS